jgi:16S rRNA (guanine(966)-N(2))-methyltransferase RsmD
MIRVIGGSVRGRRLLGPPVRKVGRQSRPGVTRTELHAETRPTSDLIRGVIFDMLDAMGADYDRVLDLYAGTGALGIEALSRGDGEADFVERDTATAATIRENLRRCGFEERGRVHRLTTQAALTRLAESGPYTLILADPPYYDDAAPEAVEAVAASGLSGPETVLVYEHHRRLVPPEAMGRLRLHKSRRHGDSVVSIYVGEDVL